jgi:hypothetical protein
VLRNAAKNGVHLLLHGHRHRVFVWNEGVFARPEFNEPEWSLGEVAIVGGGSVGSTAVDGGRNFFNLFQLKPEEIRLTMFRSTNAAQFEIMTTWSGALGHANGRLALSDWTVVPNAG